MKYYSIDFKLSPCNEAFCDVLSGEIAALGFESYEYGEDGIVGYIPCNLFDKDELDNTLAAFPIEGVQIEYTQTEAPDENWNALWEQEGFKPIRIENLICVHDTRTPAQDVTYDITINPCQAFGTGSHQTTRMLLKFLSETDLRGKRVIDAGTGTGILSFMCRMRGAEQILAYDIDEWSVRNTIDNARLNGIEDIEVREGDSSVLTPDDKANLLIANINRNILLADMERFANALLPHGNMLLSGFYVQDIPVLAERASQLGMRVVEERAEEEWAMILLETDAASWMDV